MNLTTYSKHTGRPGDYCFLLWKSEIRASNSTASVAINKLQVRKCSKKAEILYFLSYQSTSLRRKIHSSPVLSLDIIMLYIDLVWLPPWICAD